MIYYDNITYYDAKKPKARQTFWLCSASSRVGERKRASSSTNTKQFHCGNRNTNNESDKWWMLRTTDLDWTWLNYLMAECRLNPYGTSLTVTYPLKAAWGSRDVVSTLCKAPRQNTHVFPQPPSCSTVAIVSIFVCVTMFLLSVYNAVESILKKCGRYWGLNINGIQNPGRS